MITKARLVIALIAVAVAGVAVSAVLLLGGPSYPHPWCGPLLDRLHDKGGTEQAYEAAMTRLQHQDHAPVGRLLSDLYVYDYDYGVQQNASVLDVLGDIAKTKTALNKVGADLRSLNAACGQPPGAYHHDQF